MRTHDNAIDLKHLTLFFVGSIADQCEEFVDKNGQRIIDALVKDELNPQEVNIYKLIVRLTIIILSINFLKSFSIKSAKG